MAPRTDVARGEICFVEEAPGKARGGGTARVVRSHVARFRHRRQRDADVRAFQESRDGAREGGGSGEDADESETTDEELSTLEIATRSEEELVRPPIEPCLAYQDNLIPYTFLAAGGPVLMLPRSSSPFLRIASRYPNSPSLFPRQSLWMPKAIIPELSQVESSILGLELVDWISNTPSCFQFRLETIKWIQARLADPDLATRDDTLGAIMTLTMWESYRAQLKPADVVTHMSGLERVVNLRGGIDAIPPGQAAKIAIFDHIIAAMTLQQPRFPLRSQTRRLAPLIENRLYDSPLYGSLPFSSFIRGTEADKEICILLEALREVTDAFLNNLPFAHLLAHVKISYPTDPIYKALHAAGQIYIASLSSPKYFASPHSLPWLQTLSTNLDLTVLSPFWRENPGVRLWALLVGAAAAAERAERGFFMMYLARVSMLQGWENEMVFRKWSLIFSHFKIKQIDHGDYPF